MGTSLKDLVDIPRKTPAVGGMYPDVEGKLCDFGVLLCIGGA